MPDSAPESAPAPKPAPPPPPPELVPAETAFDRGDFRAARQLTEQLLAAPPSSETEAAARALQARLAVDPWALRITLIATAVLAVIVGAYVF